MGHSRWISKWNKKRNKLLQRGGAVRNGFAKLVLKQWLSKDTLPKNSGAMMCEVPSNPIKDALIIGNTRVSPKRCFSDDFYSDHMGGQLSGRVFVGSFDAYRDHGGVCAFAVHGVLFLPASPGFPDYRLPMRADKKVFYCSWIEEETTAFLEDT